MKAHPGRAKKLEPLLVHQGFSTKSLPRDICIGTHHDNPADQHLYHGKRGHDYVRAKQFLGCQAYPEDYSDWVEEDILEALGTETSDMFQDALLSSSPSKKSKQSLERKRTCSVESHQHQPLSRRQILASLELKNSLEKIPSSSPVLSAISSCSWSSTSHSTSLSPTSSLSTSPPTSEHSFPSLTGVCEGVFSRSCLIQSLSREETDKGVEGDTLDSAGDTDREESISDASEDDIDTNLSKSPCWKEDAKSFLPDPHGTSDLISDNYGFDSGEYSSPHKISLDSLCWVATLGVGGFGRVELVTAGRQKISFALKKMKKIEIKDLKQRQHILNEKAVMRSCSSPFIVQLYQTFQDTRYLYMLMEPCLGGEVWTILRNSKRFTDNTARFYVACVILAFEYLHEKGVIYRDLKPENLLLDSNGYLKLTDFGFAKHLGDDERTWTFCGTPEYVAPEIITNKSHDYRADIWSIGILVYELLTGAPPFTNKANPAQVYPEILKGIRGVFFPNYMSAPASEIIRQCCRLSPPQRPSLETLKHYVWFAGLDWVRLADRSLPPPTVPRIASSVDCSNFDKFKKDTDKPDEDFSDWAENF